MFSMAITAWSAKVVTNSICLSVRVGLWIPDGENSDQTVGLLSFGRRAPFEQSPAAPPKGEVWVSYDVGT